MCQHDQSSKPSHPPPPLSSNNTNTPFPWHLPIYDAHCHPTDTMSSTPLIASRMRASALTVMATRSQDQQLVADLATRTSGGVRTKEDLAAGSDARGSAVVVPSFGWHPWFSHMILDDLSPRSEQADPATAAEEQDGKQAHYSSVLTPPPDPSFTSSLPSPITLSSLLTQISANLASHPHALVGEIGLDKAFRLPLPGPSPGTTTTTTSSSDLTPGGREGRLLSPHRVRTEHQRVILEAQLRLAGEHRRAVSVHGVQAHGLLLETAAGCWRGRERKVQSRRQRRLVAEGAESDSDDDDDDHEEGPQPDVHRGTTAGGGGGGGGPLPYPPRICLHSFSATPEVARQWLRPDIPCAVYFSFSVAVNAATEPARRKLAALLRELPDASILVESDLHVAGDDMDQALEDMYRFVCDVKGWSLEHGVKRIARNYESFIFGSDKAAGIRRERERE